MSLPRRRAVCAALAALVLLPACVAAPDLDRTLARAAKVDATTMVLAADGSVLAELHAEIDRRPVPLAQIPTVMRDAVIAIEDARFYRHAGISWPAVARALMRDIAEGAVVEGGSTITQQLVKNTLIEPERSLKRKVREAVLAHELERRWSKDEILERYLNTVYFGRGAYGVEAAARAYFGTRASQLTLPHAALLAGMIRAPSRFDPAIDPKAARGRRDVVLARMRALGMIDRVTHAVARGSSLGVRTRRTSSRYRAAYFVEHVKDLILDDEDASFAAFGRTRGERANAIFRGGLRIQTTLDTRLQATAEQVARRTLPERRDPSTAFVALDPKDGAIRAMVGGRDFFDTRDPHAKFNLASQARRQPGSAFKPFTLIAALEQGIPLTKTYQGGSRITLRLPGGEAWPVRNYEGNSFGGSMSLLRATALSVNVVYAQVVLDVGAHRVVEVARRMGVRSELRAYPAIALGAQEVTPLELASAYAPLANGGYRAPPVAITRITDASGKVLYRAAPKRQKILDGPVVAQTIDALQEVMRSGTGRHLDLGIPSAGKTGTSDEYHDAWFAGFTPRLVAVSWVGFPQAQIPMRPPRTRIRVFGSSWPGRMWRAFMLEAHKGLPAAEFPTPPTSLVAVEVDVLRGCRPNIFTPDFLIEERTFMRGQEPVGVCREPASSVVDAVPSVLGRTPDDARVVLRRAFLDQQVVRRYCPSHRPGTICAQEPAAGTRALVGSVVRVFVSDDTAMATVPIVLGRTLASAERRLRARGFEVFVVERDNSASYTGCRDASVRGNGVVWAQDPCGGAEYGRGSTITLYVN